MDIANFDAPYIYVCDDDEREENDIFDQYDQIRSLFTATEAQQLIY